MIDGRLGYNNSNQRYGILVSDLWEHDGLHCGEVFQVFVDEKWEKDRIEYSHKDKEWYMVQSKLRGRELEYLRVRYGE